MMFWFAEGLIFLLIFLVFFGDMVARGLQNIWAAVRPTKVKMGKTYSNKTIFPHVVATGAANRPSLSM